MSDRMHVAIVALGPSSMQFLKYAEGAGGSKSYCDEVWGVNMNGGVLQCDRIFHMDDLKIQEMRIAYGSPIAEKLTGMLAWMKDHPGPIYTSRAYADYPGSVDYPLEDVIRATGAPYYNNTVPYALALAISLPVKKMSLFGLDYTYPDSQAAETGRACCEYWLGRAHGMGIEVFIAPESTLMDVCKPVSSKFYGYDTLDVSVEIKNGDVQVRTKPKLKLPDIGEIERTYNTSAWACRSKHEVRGGEALDRLMAYEDVKTVLDVGSGEGEQAQIMRDAGLKVTTVSYIPPADIVGDFNKALIPVPSVTDKDGNDINGFDAIWASHTLEHQVDVHTFLKRCHQLLRDDGVFAVTVPPSRDGVLGGHVTLWNTGLVLYNLIIAGFDCSEARVSGCYPCALNEVPYNLSVIVRKKTAQLPDLDMDFGDIGRLQNFFPVPVAHGFDGNLTPVRW